MICSRFSSGSSGKIEIGSLDLLDDPILLEEIVDRAPIDFGNNRIEPIGNRFSVGKFNRIYRYFGFGKLPFGFGKFGFGFGFSIYRTDLPII